MRFGDERSPRSCGAGAEIGSLRQARALRLCTIREQKKSAPRTVHAAPDAYGYCEGLPGQQTFLQGPGRQDASRRGAPRPGSGRPRRRTTSPCYPGCAAPARHAGGGSIGRWGSGWPGAKRPRRAARLAPAPRRRGQRGRSSCERQSSGGAGAKREAARAAQLDWPTSRASRCPRASTGRRRGKLWRGATAERGMMRRRVAGLARSPTRGTARRPCGAARLARPELLHSRASPGPPRRPPRTESPRPPLRRPWCSASRRRSPAPALPPTRS